MMTKAQDAMAERAGKIIATVLSMDLQARLDAFADAETLLCFAYDKGASHQTFLILENLMNASDDAVRAMRSDIPDKLCACGCNNPSRRWHYAELAGHAAFLACPGLRR